MMLAEEVEMLDVDASRMCDGESSSRLVKKLRRVECSAEVPVLAGDEWEDSTGGLKRLAALSSREKTENGLFEAMDGRCESVAAEAGVTLAVKETDRGVSVLGRLFGMVSLVVGRACKGLVANCVEGVLVPTKGKGRRDKKLRKAGEEDK